MMILCFLGMIWIQIGLHFVRIINDFFQVTTNINTTTTTVARKEEQDYDYLIANKLPQKIQIVI